MQNLPITATPTIISTQAPVPTDNNAVSSEAEPFGSVLARQRAIKDKSNDTPQPQDKQTVSSVFGDVTSTVIGTEIPPSLVTDAASIVAVDKLAPTLSASTLTSNHPSKAKAHPQASSQDAPNTLPSDMLAMLLPVNVDKNVSTSLEKSDPKVSGQQGVKVLTGKSQTTTFTDTNAGNGNSNLTKGIVDSQLPASGVLPGEVLSSSMPLATVTDKRAQFEPVTTIMDQTGVNKSAPVADRKAKFEPVTTVALGAEQQSAVTKATPAPAGKIAFDNALSTDKNNTFTATLEAINKDNLKAQQNDPVKVTLPNQTGVASAMANMVQNGIAPLGANQNGAAQVVQAVINTPVSHDRWGDEFNQKVTWMVTQRDQTAQLHLNPPNLGPLDVVLNVSGDQATALFTSPHAAVRDAVEQALPQLRNMLADNGITLGNAMVSDQSPKDQQAWQASQQQKGNGGTARTLEVNTVTAGIPAPSNVSLGRIHQGMVDTFV